MAVKLYDPEKKPIFPSTHWVGLTYKERETQIHASVSKWRAVRVAYRDPRRGGAAICWSLHVEVTRRGFPNMADPKLRVKMAAISQTGLWTLEKVYKLIIPTPPFTAPDLRKAPELFVFIIYAPPPTSLVVQFFYPVTWPRHI